jgi:two-component system, OmpR family, KDP operon response regulator KdpE
MSASRERVLVIEDDPAYARVVRLTLEASGYRVAHASSGQAGLTLVTEFRPNLLILDVMLPDMDGLEVCRRVREQSELPIIMLTARGSEQHKVQGLLTGADDYVTKPFSAAELLARIVSVLRRARLREAPQGQSKLTVGDLVIDLDARHVTWFDRPVELTATEFKLLSTLASHPGRVMLQDELLVAVWGPGYQGDPELLRTTVRRLRRKLPHGAANHVQNVRAVGYVLRPPQG